MAISEQYRQQVALLIRLIPLVAEEECFALKGGTAINLFIRDLPRLSVDIDLTYLPLEPREKSLQGIDAAIKRIGKRAETTIANAKTEIRMLQPENTATKAVIKLGRTQVKIEVTPVLRGCVYEPELCSVSSNVEDTFGFAEIKILSFADIYAGKALAALDRQHPRDLFDVYWLLENEGITDGLREAFMVYLLSHGRGFHEVLAPSRLDMSHEYEHGFMGMTDSPIPLETLYEAREELISQLCTNMPERHKLFLLGFMEGKPDWSQLKIPHAKNLPAVKWRMLNLEKLTPDRRIELIAILKEALGQ